MPPFAAEWFGCIQVSATGCPITNKAGVLPPFTRLFGINRWIEDGLKSCNHEFIDYIIVNSITNYDEEVCYQAGDELRQRFQCRSIEVWYRSLCQPFHCFETQRMPGL